MSCCVLPSSLPDPLLPGQTADPRCRLLAMYAEIHARGVVHGDPDWRHVLWAAPEAEADLTASNTTRSTTPAGRSAKGTTAATDLRLIDFDRSLFRSDTDAEAWREACDFEMSQVRAMVSGGAF